MSVLDNPKWPLLAKRYGFDWVQMEDRDKVNFICVTEYNRERQRRVDADPRITEFVGRVAEAEHVSQSVMDRLQAMKDAACEGMQSVEEREAAMLKTLSIKREPAKLVQNPMNGTYDVMFDGVSYLHITREELADNPDAVRAQIKATIDQLNKQEQNNHD